MKDSVPAIVEKAHELGITIADPTDFEVIPGHGVKSHLLSAVILVGNDKLLKSFWNRAYYPDRALY